MSRKADELLTQWGIWTRQRTGVPRYVSPMLAIMRDNVPGSHGADAMITEEDAEEVSALVARLSRDSVPSKARGGWNGAQIAEVLHLYYCAGFPAHLVGERTEQRRNRQQVAAMLDSGIWYVQAALDMADAMEAAIRNSKSLALPTLSM